MFRLGTFEITAEYAVGCDCESAVEVFTVDHADMLSQSYGLFDYIAFFGSDGKKVNEVKVTGDGEGEPFWVTTDF